MTTAVALPAPVTTGAARVLAAARLQAVSWPLLIAWPVGLLAVSAAIPWAIFSLVETGQQYNITGSLLSVYGFVVAFYLVAMTQIFSFALRLGVTRAHYLLSVGLIAVAQCALTAAVFQLLSVLEAATGGWGVRMRMFGLLRFLTDSTVLQYLAYVSSLLLVVGGATLIGALHHRWRTVGLLTVAAATVVAGGLAAVVVTWTGSWPALGSWFADAPRPVTLVVLPLATAALCGAGAWRVARRSAP